MNINKIYEYTIKITDTYCKKKVEYFDAGNYFGDIKNGMMHGEGFLCYSDNSAYDPTNFNPGANYVGGFKKSLPDSKQGLFTYKDGTEYLGEIKAAMWHGQGTILWTNGDKYIGEWNKDKEIGKGVFFKSHNNKWPGRGTFIYKDGNNCIGGDKNIKKHALGTIKWKNGDKYNGPIKDNLPNGKKGSLSFKNGKFYTGELKDGKFHGTGSLFRFKDGQPYGSFERGLFKEGKFVERKTSKKLK